jgi:hypothetical protein
LAAFEREFEEWMEHEYNHHCLLLEEQQQDAIILKEMEMG